MKDFVVLVVKEEDGFICGVAEKPFFRGNAKCLILKDGE